MEVTKQEYEELLNRITKLEEEVHGLKAAKSMSQKDTVKNPFGINSAALHDATQPFLYRNVESAGKTSDVNVDDIDDYFDRDIGVEAPIKKTRKPINIEYILGSGLMGIIASVLIFIGVASIVGMLGDVPALIKVGVMYTISFIFTLYGYILVKRNKTPYAISTLGCGFGAIYVSTLVGSFGIHGFNEIIAVCIMIVISFITAIVAKGINSEQFKLIGFSGMSVAVLLVVCSKYRLNLPVVLVFLWLYTLYNLMISSKYLETKNWTFYTMYGISYTIQNALVISFAYSLHQAAINPTNSFDLFTEIMRTGSSSIAFAPIYVISYNELNILLSILILISLSIINFVKMQTFTDRCRKDIDNTFKILLNFTNIFIFMMFAITQVAYFVGEWDNILLNDILKDAVYLYGFITGYILLNFTGIVEKSKYAYPIYIGIIGATYFGCTDNIAASLLIIPFFLVETYKARRRKGASPLIKIPSPIVSILALVMVAIVSMFHILFAPSIMYLIALILFSAYIWLCAWKERLEAYSIKLDKSYKDLTLFYKIIGYYTYLIAETALIIYMGVNDILTDEPLFALWSVLTAILIVLHQITYISADWNKEKIDRGIDIFRLCRCSSESLDGSYSNNFVFHLIYLAVLLLLLQEITGISGVIVAMTVLAVISADLRFIFEKSIIVETEIVVAFYRILDTYIGSYKYLISVCLIILAIISILAGNKYKFKNFRIYGLTLVLLSATKLVVFDFMTTGIGAIGTIVAGILCLGIVFIYNKGNRDNE